MTVTEIKEKLRAEIIDAIETLGDCASGVAKHISDFQKGTAMELREDILEDSCNMISQMWTTISVYKRFIDFLDAAEKGPFDD